MSIPRPPSPPLLTWTAQSWLPVAMPWPLGAHHRLKFVHLRTTVATADSRPCTCVAYGHTLWSCVNSDQAIGIGWEWAMLDGASRCLAQANPMAIASNLRFMDLRRNCYLNEREAAVPLNHLVAQLDWQAEIARSAGLDLLTPAGAETAKEVSPRYLRKRLPS